MGLVDEQAHDHDQTPSSSLLLGRQLTTNVGNNSLAQVVGPEKRHRSRRVKVFSRGSRLERQSWNLLMRAKRAEKNKFKTENQAVELLTTLQRMSSRQSRYKIRRTKRGSLFTKDCVQVSCLKTSRGNRFQSTHSVSDFLAGAFGTDKLKGKVIANQSAAALSLQVSPSTLAYMRAVVCGSIISRQCGMLGQIFLLCKREKPMVVGLREAFDETSQLVSVKKEKGAWQIIVLRHTLLIVWPGPGAPRVAKFPIIFPPLLVLSPSADKLSLCQSCSKVFAF